MRIRCISNQGSSLPSELIRPEIGYTKDMEFPLKVGKEYVVYGITVFNGHPWYYVCDEAFTYYPVWKPWTLFAVTDGKISQYWKTGHVPIRDGIYMFLIAFSEWVDDPLYYDRLTDGVTNEVKVFASYKAKMDLE